MNNEKTNIFYVVKGDVTAISHEVNVNPPFPKIAWIKIENPFEVYLTEFYLWQEKFNDNVARFSLEKTATVIDELIKNDDNKGRAFKVENYRVLKRSETNIITENDIDINDKIRFTVASEPKEEENKNAASSEK